MKKNQLPTGQDFRTIEFSNLELMHKKRPDHSERFLCIGFLIQDGEDFNFLSESDQEEIGRCLGLSS